MNARNTPVINYHKIEPENDIGITTRHPSDFIEDMKLLLRNGYTPITFKDLKHKQDLPAQPVIITFDDAYLSFYKYALNFLTENRLKVVLFVPVGFIGKTNDWDVQFFKKRYKHMDKQQLIECAQQGMEIGSHGLSHRFLNYLKPENVKYELKKSKAILEDVIGDDIISFSYPFGRANSMVVDIAAEYYDYGIQLLSKKNRKSERFNYTINRINIYRNDTKKTFLKKLRYQNYPLLRFKTRLIQSGAWGTIILQQLKNKNGSK